MREPPAPLAGVEDRFAPPFDPATPANDHLAMCVATRPSRPIRWRRSAAPQMRFIA
jgi:hypothetical protein